MDPATIRLPLVTCQRLVLKTTILVTFMSCIVIKNQLVCEVPQPIFLLFIL